LNFSAVGFQPAPGNKLGGTYFKAGITSTKKADDVSNPTTEENEIEIYFYTCNG
jgi:hypothetical protein